MQFSVESKEFDTVPENPESIPESNRVLLVSHISCEIVGSEVMLAAEKREGGHCDKSN